MKEIERKWFLKSGVNYLDIVGNDKQTIRDYYLDKQLRIRNIKDNWFVTFKSLGKLVRDEYEFQIIAPNKDMLPKVFLEKERFKVYFRGKTFEVNVFSNILLNNSEKLVLVECELSEEKEKIDLPNWLGTEVTNVSYLYGYNLFKSLENRNKELINGKNT